MSFTTVRHGVRQDNWSEGRFRCRWLSVLRSSTEFDDSLPGIEAGFKCGPKPIEGGEQCGGSAVAQADPSNFEFRLWALSEVQKILIFADDDAIMVLGMAADFRVRSLGQPDIEHVLAIQAAFLKMLRKRNG